MANPNPPPPPQHTRFKPGESGNPAGKPRGLLTKAQVKTLVSQYWSAPTSELVDVMEDPSAPAGEKWIASIMLQGIKRGDANRLSYLLDRVIGKVGVDEETAAEVRATAENAAQLWLEARKSLPGLASVGSGK